MVKWLLLSTGAGIFSSLFGVLLKFLIVPPLVEWQIEKVNRAGIIKGDFD